MKTLIPVPPFLIPLILALACIIGLVPKVQALSPPPDGAYPNFTTAEGQNALQDLTTGAANTALGTYSLFGTTTGSFNTAVGAGALDLNTGDNNTAVGVAALLLNTGTDNTAIGVDALGLNTAGQFNAAVGVFALYNNTTGTDNTAIGVSALKNNTTGGQNIAIGEQALQTNTAGNHNNAIGNAALDNCSGDDNVALGHTAGSSATTGSNNVYIGANLTGVAGESNACYIASIFGETSANGIPVLINSNSKLGTATSSKRFKKDIKPMDKASEALFSLTPVSFHYKEEIDPTGTSQFGLVAEDVARINHDLVVCDKEGKPYTVRYDAVNAMLLNEFLKEHRKVQELESTLVRQEASAAKQQAAIAAQQKQIEVLTAGLQKVSAQLELSKPAPQVVNNP
jgi:hypothetical protein